MTEADERRCVQEGGRELPVGRTDMIHLLTQLHFAFSLLMNLLFVCLCFVATVWHWLRALYLSFVIFAFVFLFACIVDWGYL